MNTCIRAEQLLCFRQPSLDKWLRDEAHFPLAQTIISVQLMATEVCRQQRVMATGAGDHLAGITWNDLECELHATPALPCCLDCNLTCVLCFSAADGLLALQPVPWRKDTAPTLSQDGVWCTVIMPYMVFLLWTREVRSMSPHLHGFLLLFVTIML